MSRVLVTGATGFVGSNLCTALTRSGYSVRAALRSSSRAPENVAERVVVGEVGRMTDWDAALEGVDLVIHAAARAHVVGDNGNDALYEEANAEGTRRLAEAAAKRHVRRLVYLSSIKVNGEYTTDRPFKSTDSPNPSDIYGRTKFLGERYLKDVAEKAGFEAVVVRPPLVYGPGVRANFLRLLQAVHRGQVLPLARIHNRRSLVSVWNLCDLLVRVVGHRDCASGTWLVSDGADLSTPELIAQIAAAMRKQARLFPVPPVLLKAIGQLVGKGAEMRRLCRSLELDITHTCERFQWSPSASVADSIQRTVDWYLSTLGSDGIPRRT